MTHTFDSGGFFTLLVALAHGGALAVFFDCVSGGGAWCGGGVHLGRIGEN